jgi:hypothetical protein
MAGRVFVGFCKVLIVVGVLAVAVHLTLVP